MTTTTLPGEPPGPPDAGDQGGAADVELGEEAPHRAELARHPGRLGGRLRRCSRARTPWRSALQDTTDLHQLAQRARDWVQLEGQDNWFFGGVIGAHRRLPQLDRRAPARS